MQPKDSKPAGMKLKKRPVVAIVGLLAVAMSASLLPSTATADHRQPGDPIAPTYRIYSLRIEGMSMVGALLMVGRQLHMPMGIRYLDTDAVENQVHANLTPKRSHWGEFSPMDLRTAMDFILRFGADYTWSIRGTVLVSPINDAYPGIKPFGSPIQIDNRRAQWPSRNLLNVRLAKFAIPRCTIEEASHRLEMALDAALNPGTHGVAGDCHSPTGNNLVGPLHLRRHTVTDILDELVAREKNAAWVVQVPPESVDRLPPEGLWKIIEYDDPAFDQAIAAVKKNILRYPKTASTGPGRGQP
jgi:hypothetical protein